MIVVASTTVKLVAGLAPKVTAVAPVRPVPVMVTSSFRLLDRMWTEARNGRSIGISELGGSTGRAGAGGSRDRDIDDTSTVGGETAVIVVALTTVKLVAGLAPKVTAVAPVKPSTGDGHGRTSLFVGPEDGLSPEIPA